METRAITAFEFHELSGKAKQQAMETVGQWQASDAWYEFTIEEFKTRLQEMGFTDPVISFSGFWSQGDGASFTSGWCNLSKLFDNIDLPERVKRHRRFYEELLAVRIVRTSHHYSHENTCQLEIHSNGYRWSSRLHKRISNDISELDDAIERLRRGLCHEIYASLEQEYEYLVSEECISEVCEINNYRFDENGEVI